MKKTILTLIFLTNLSVMFSQEKDEKLFFEIKNFIKVNNESNFEKMVEYFPEFTFDSISRREFLSQLKEVSSSTMNVNIKMDNIFEIDTLITLNKVKYARINLPQETTVNFSEFKDKGGADFASQMAYLSLVKEYGEENVKLDKEKWTITIVNVFPIYAIEEKSGWKFTVLNKKTKNYIPKTIQKSIQ
ncbi:hypothetical protein NO995_16045 [Aestuariibaculum sp. M13]|uniref:hypothetical protein n=1 Tax=Aestuariibaculum sp. M13 TaxID=2967132 RepID=UPI002159DC04|nr:hypothetical protein [Aestuariibaculum sp. M13]MCR8669199.1 hypothetical protein [Aestuariibaculum sp. M13]